METQRVSWILLAGVSVPAVVTEQKDGTYIATSPDWRVAANGKTATEALRELSRELDRKVERALAESRRVATQLETGPGRGDSSNLRDERSSGRVQGHLG